MRDRMQETSGAPADAAHPVGIEPWLSFPALDRIVALAADLFAAPAACLALRRHESALVPASIGLAAMDRPAAWRFPLSAPEPVAIADLAADPRSPCPRLVAGVPQFYAGAPVPGADGAPLGTLCVMAPDPRPEASATEVERLAALAELAGEVIEVQRARARAEALSEARAGLLADVSHEMRTPLTAIMGFIEVLNSRASLDGDALRALHRIDEAGRGLLTIVGDALDLARCESGLVRLDLRPFSPTRVIEDAAAMVRADAERKGLSLVVDLGATSGGVLMGDPDRLRQVVLNLLSNAVKFTASGSVRVALTAGRSVEGAVPLTVRVEDSGVGIAAEGLPRLFRRFAQADDSVAGRFGGSGLGLAISKSLVEAMGGRIAVHSTPGEGSRFVVSLTLRRAARARPAGPSRRRRTVAPDGLRGLAILVAEDTAINQKLVLQMLETFGATVDVVADGVEAVAAVQRQPYALVLMDMEMPVLGGLDAARRIRALAGPAAAVPIVALTANVYPEQLARCREAGMDDHLTKPFAADDLAAKALRWARPPAAAGPT